MYINCWRQSIYLMCIVFRIYNFDSLLPSILVTAMLNHIQGRRKIWKSRWTNTIPRTFQARGVMYHSFMRINSRQPKRPNILTKNCFLWHFGAQTYLLNCVISSDLQLKSQSDWLCHKYWVTYLDYMNLLLMLIFPG